MADVNTPSSPRGAQTLLRGLGLLEELARLTEAASVGELAMRLQLTKPTTSRLLAALRDARYVSQDEKTRRYRLTGKIFALGEAFANQLDVREAARPHLRHLSENTGETVHLGILDGPNVMYIDKLESTRSIRIGSATGQVMPISTTALGKAICSAMDDSDYKHLLGKIELVKKTNKSVTEIAQFHRIVSESKMRGYAIDDEENEPGVTCIASAVSGPYDVIGAISLSGPTTRMQSQIDDIGIQVNAAAKKISAEMGARDNL